MLKFKKFYSISIDNCLNKFTVAIFKYMKFLIFIRLIFEDATLKKDVEKYLGNGLQIAIKGFSANDWGVRNSSLMLFSSLSKRTFGTNKSADQNSMKNCLNILEFFTRAPQLLDFFLKEITDFINSSTRKKYIYIKNYYLKKKKYMMYEEL